MKNARQLAALVTIATIMPAATAINATEGVSPGAADRAPTIEGRCPSFSWGAVNDAALYEVVAYRLPETNEIAELREVELSQANEVFYTRVVGAALSWTPELEQCFAAGGSYVWFVRAVFDKEDVLEAGRWSQGLYFSVAAAPSAREVRQALGVLQRYLEDGGGGGDAELTAIISGTESVSETGSGSGSGTLNRTRSTGANKLAGEALPGTAAIRGEQVDPTGETYGVYGITNSSTDGSLAVVGEATAATGEVYGVAGLTASIEGAGVIAYNAADGPDLQLTSDSAGSAWLTEAGLDRNYPAPVTFNFENSSPTGSMALQIDGVEVVTTATDQDTVGGLSCVHDQIARWNTVLGEWECSDDVDTDTDTLGALACGPNQIPKWSGTFWFCSPDGDTTYSAGNQLNLVATTFNVVEGPGSGLSADTLDGFDSVDFADVSHGHFGQTWTGSAASGLKIENTSSATSFALDGRATAATGGTYGVFGKSSSNAGTGVWGWADAATGVTYGVSGLSSSQSGHGIHGEASHGTGPTKGVSGESGSTNGIGVYGEATASSGPTRGVMGRSDSTDGRGVYGYAGDATGENSGVYGQTGSADGYGVYGENTAGGMAGFFAGDVAQSESAGGFVKAAVEVYCSSSTSYVARSMNLVPDAGPITITNGIFVGTCVINFGFPMNDRFWAVSTTEGIATSSCNVSLEDNLACFNVDPTGAFTDGLIDVIVF